MESKYNTPEVSVVDLNAEQAFLNLSNQSTINDWEREEETWVLG